MYCIRVLLAHYVQYTFRVGCPCCLFREGQRRPECMVSQCGNPRFFMAFDYDYTGNPALLDRRTGWQTAQTRNYTIATMAEESVYALRTDGRPSSLDVLCGLELGRKPVRCFPQ